MAATGSFASKKRRTKAAARGIKRSLSGFITPPERSSAS
jgi:hypothetical protein